MRRYFPILYKLKLHTKRTPQCTQSGPHGAWHLLSGGHGAPREMWERQSSRVAVTGKSGCSSQLLCHREGTPSDETIYHLSGTPNGKALFFYFFIVFPQFKYDFFFFLHFHFLKLLASYSQHVDLISCFFPLGNLVCFKLDDILELRK